MPAFHDLIRAAHPWAKTFLQSPAYTFIAWCTGWGQGTVSSRERCWNTLYTDGNTTPAVSFDSCLSLTWAVFCYPKVWTPTAGIQVPLLFTIFERRLAGDSHVLPSYFAEKRESCVVIQNANILTNKTNICMLFPEQAVFSGKTYQCIVFRIHAMFFLPWPFFYFYFYFWFYKRKIPICL